MKTRVRVIDRRSATICCCALLVLGGCDAGERRAATDSTPAAVTSDEQIKTRNVYLIEVIDAGERPDAVARAIASETGLSVESIESALESLPYHVLDQCPGTRTRRIVGLLEEAGAVVRLTAQTPTEESRRLLLDRGG